MFVYHPGGGNMTVYVTPAADERGAPLDGVSQWKDPSTGEPIQMKVVFTNGRAEVDRTLGEWLIKRGHARRTGLILPGDPARRRA